MSDGTDFAMRIQARDADASKARYRPTKGDLAYRDWRDGRKFDNPFEEAILLRKVSDAYLSVILSENTGERSAPFKALIEAEMTRRGSHVARRANIIALVSVAIATASAVASAVALIR